MSYAAARRAQIAGQLERFAETLRAPEAPRDLTRLRDTLSRLREAHCSIETPSGICISPALKALIEKQDAEMGAP